MLFCVALLTIQFANLKRHGSVVKFESLSFFSVIICIIFGAIYGTLFACHNIEGGTVAMGLPFSVAIFAQLFRQKKLLAIAPIAVVFFVGHLVTLALLISWYLIWGGFPEFSQLPESNGNWIASFYATANHKEL